MRIDKKKVGIVIDLIMRSGESKPVLFETGRSEFKEVIEKIKEIDNIESHQEVCFQNLVLRMMGIIPFDHTFFNSAVFLIASSSIYTDYISKYPNDPVAFSIMIREDVFPHELYPMKYKVWREILNHQKKSYRLKV